MAATPIPRRLQVSDDGRVTLPANLRHKLGLKQGGSVSVVETPGGLLLTTERLLADRDFELVDAELRKQRLSLDELIESGREIRGDLLTEMSVSSTS
jgi:AbrB family looped-hinge helix DNA binding protein